MTFSKCASTHVPSVKGSVSHERESSYCIWALTIIHHPCPDQRCPLQAWGRSSLQGTHAFVGQYNVSLVSESSNKKPHANRTKVWGSHITSPTVTAIVTVRVYGWSSVPIEGTSSACNHMQGLAWVAALIWAQATRPDSVNGDIFQLMEDPRLSGCF